MKLKAAYVLPSQSFFSVFFFAFLSFLGLLLIKIIRLQKLTEERRRRLKYANQISMF